MARSRFGRGNLDAARQYLAGPVASAGVPFPKAPAQMAPAQVIRQANQFNAQQQAKLPFSKTAARGHVATAEHPGRAPRSPARGGVAPAQVAQYRAAPEVARGTRRFSTGGRVHYGITTKQQLRDLLNRAIDDRLIGVRFQLKVSHPPGWRLIGGDGEFTPRQILRVMSQRIQDPETGRWRTRTLQELIEWLIDEAQSALEPDLDEGIGVILDPPEVISTSSRRPQQRRTRRQSRPRTATSR